MSRSSNINSFKLFGKMTLDDVYLKHARPLIVADRLRTPENMGAVLRLAGNAGASGVWFVNDGEEKGRSWKIKKTASGAERKVKWSFVPVSELKQMIPDGFQVVAIETSANAVNLYDVSLPEKAVFVVGNEVTGVSEEVLALARTTVFVPVHGPISSLNVTHALSVVLFEWIRQQFWNNR